MSRADELRQGLRDAGDVEAFLRERSGLPGPRANLELAWVVADEGDERLFRRLLRWGPERAPGNTPEAFLVLCGVVGLGALLAKGRSSGLVAELRELAADPRWRVREGVAMALQRWGRADFDAMLAEVRGWADGSRLEQRAAVAAVCEPDLLRSERQAAQALALLDVVTGSLVAAPDRSEEGYRVLRQALGYCWSVAVAALPEEGAAHLDRWTAVDDADVRWVMRENLKKKRLAVAGRDRLERWRAAVAG
jgi:hypothetical protein